MALSKKSKQKKAEKRNKKRKQQRKTNLQSSAQRIKQAKTRELLQALEAAQSKMGTKATSHRKKLGPGRPIELVKRKLNEHYRELYSVQGTD